MKRVCILLILVVVLGFSGMASATLITSSTDPALDGSTLIDFNTESLGSFTSRTFGGFVTFSSTQALYVDNNYSGSYGASGTHLANRGNPDPIRIDFAQNVSAFGFSWGAAEYPWTMSLYNDNGLLETLSVAAQSVGFIGGTNYANSIAYAILTDLSDYGGYDYGYDYIILDNLEYVVAKPIPEPATMLLLGSGLVGLAGFRKKFRKN